MISIRAQRSLPGRTMASTAALIRQFSAAGESMDQQQQQQQQPNSSSSALSESISRVFGDDVGIRLNSLLHNHLIQASASSASIVSTMENVELLDLRSHGMGVGLMAARDLTRGDTVIAIPPSLWQPLSVDTAREAMPEWFTQCVDAALAPPPTKDNNSNNNNSSKNSGVGDVESDEGSQGVDMSSVFETMMTKQVLYHTLHVASQMHMNNNDNNKTKHKLGAYLDILSQTPLDVPMFWSEANLSTLQGTPVPNTVLERRQFIARLYESFVRPAYEIGLEEIVNVSAAGDHASLFQGASSSNFAWAYSLVLSRALSGGGGAHYSLVPVIDWINHSRLPLLPTSDSVPNGLCTISHDRSTDCFVVRVVDDVKQGTQLVAEYGQLGNAELLRQYGFATHDNVFDRVLVEVNDVEQKMESEVEEEQQQQQRRGFFVSHMDLLPRTLVTFVRQSVEKEGGQCVKQQGKQINDGDDYTSTSTSNSGTDMAVEVEAQVARRLLSAVQQALGRYSNDSVDAKSDGDADVFVKRTVQGEVQLLHKVEALLKEFAALDNSRSSDICNTSEARDLALFARRRA